MTNAERPIAVDLFAGAGGMSLGFEQAGFDVLAAVEIDPVHCATHEFNFPSCATLCASIIDLSGDDIRSRSAIGKKQVDVVFGGPPCQGFSMIGKRALDDDRNQLVFHFIRIVLELNPRYFVMENVSGLTLGEHKNFLLEIISEFKANGYDVESAYKVLNAANYGVPQSRKRLFLFGCRNDERLPTYPLPTTALPNAKSGLFDLFKLPSCPNVEDALGDLPHVDDKDELFSRDCIKAKFGKPSRYAAILRSVHHDPEDKAFPRNYDDAFLTCSLLTVHTAESIKRFSRTKSGETEPISRFFKLDPKGICNTIRAGTPSNRGAFTSPRPIHPTSPRCITVREAARLHSYPDWFRFHATKWHGFRQVGNSVPPLLARAVAQQIISASGANVSKPKETVELGESRLLQLNMSNAAERYGVDPHVIEPRKRQALEGANA